MTVTGTHEILHGTDYEIFSLSAGNISVAMSVSPRCGVRVIVEGRTKYGRLYANMAEARKAYRSPEMTAILDYVANAKFPASI